jgi:hypothetical protein
MPIRIPRNVVITCQRPEVESYLDTYREQYELDNMTGYQVGTGFGAFIEIMLVFRLREANEKRRAA